MSYFESKGIKQSTDYETLLPLIRPLTDYDIESAYNNIINNIPYSTGQKTTNIINMSTEVPVNLFGSQGTTEGHVFHVVNINLVTMKLNGVYRFFFNNDGFLPLTKVSISTDIKSISDIPIVKGTITLNKLFIKPKEKIGVDIPFSMNDYSKIRLIVDQFTAKNVNVKIHQIITAIGLKTIIEAEAFVPVNEIQIKQPFSAVNPVAGGRYY